MRTYFLGLGIVLCLPMMVCAAPVICSDGSISNANCDTDRIPEPLPTMNPNVLTTKVLPSYTTPTPLPNRSAMVIPRYRGSTAMIPPERNVPNEVPIASQIPAWAPDDYINYMLANREQKQKNEADTTPQASSLPFKTPAIGGPEEPSKPRETPEIVTKPLPKRLPTSGATLPIATMVVAFSVYFFRRNRSS